MTRQKAALTYQGVALTYQGVALTLLDLFRAALTILGSLKATKELP